MIRISAKREMRSATVIMRMVLMGLIGMPFIGATLGWRRSLSL
jgi:hypothetical protein